MKTVILMVLLVVSTVAVSFAGALAQELGLKAAAEFPYEILSQDYVPSLYFPAEPLAKERLAAAPDFPYSTCDLCYSPSLYYEAWKIAAAEKAK